MLKAHISKLVEDSLRETRPGAVFTLAVLGALPVATAQAAVAGGIATGAAATGKATAGAATTTAAGIGAALLGGLAGALIGMTGGFFGMWFGIRNSATVRLRRYMMKCCAVTYAFVWLFLGYQGMCGVLFWRTPAQMVALSAAGWALYIVLLFLLITASNRIGTRILKEDAGQLPVPSSPLEHSSLSRRRVWMTLVWTFPLALVGSAATVFWIASMPWTHFLWPAAAAFAGLTHSVFAGVYRKASQISYDDDAFAANPPSLSAEDRLSQLAGKGVARQKSPKALFYNDLAILAGTIFGPMLPLAGMAAEQKDLVTVVVVALVSASVLMGGMILRKFVARRWVYFSACMFMGAFYAGVMSLKGAGWTEAGIMQLPGNLRHLPAAIPLAIYWCIGFALLLTLPKQKPGKNVQE